MLLYFGFTFCPDICPNELVKMGRALDILEEDSSLPKVVPIFITVDPHRDSVAQMKEYVKDFHPRTVALTGTADQVARATRAFRVYFSNVDHRDEDDDDYVGAYCHTCFRSRCPPALRYRIVQWTTLSSCISWTVTANL